jgi:hypothetical protein
MHTKKEIFEMKKLLILSISIILFGGCNIKIEPTSNANITVSQNGNSVDIKVQQSNSNTTASNNQTNQAKPENVANKPKEVAETSSGEMITVKIFMRCGIRGSLIDKKVKIKNTPGILRATLEATIKDHQSPNHCDSSFRDQSIEDVTINNGLAEIRLKDGVDYEADGQCDYSVAWIAEETALQFPSVKKVEVYQNGFKCKGDDGMLKTGNN